MLFVTDVLPLMTRKPSHDATSDTLLTSTGGLLTTAKPAVGVLSAWAESTIPQLCRAATAACRVFTVASSCCTCCCSAGSPLPCPCAAGRAHGATTRISPTTATIEHRDRRVVDIALLLCEGSASVAKGQANGKRQFLPNG